MTNHDPQDDSPNDRVGWAMIVLFLAALIVACVLKAWP